MIGKIISHYKIIEEIGHGGMGIVYKAEDIKLDRLVALKFLSPHLTENETDKARFLQEAKAASAINHPNVCVIYDLLENEGQQFIVMEYVEGKTLKEIVGAQNSVPLDQAINYAIQISEALQAAHEKGIVHRDIKSENIMVNSKNQIKVMDFGLAKLKGSLNLTKSSSTVGTVSYMSPEQIQGQEVDARSDIFSFGVLLYEMLTGQLPFKGDYEAAVIYSILNEEPVPAQKHRPDLPPEFLPVVSRTLEKKPEDRYQIMNDLLKDLRQLQVSATTSAGLPSVFNSLLRIFRKPAIIIPAIVILIMVFLVVVLVFNRNKKIHWAKYEAIPQIQQLAGEDKFKDAFDLTCEIESYIQDSSTLLDLWACTSRPITVHTEPQGAKVFWKEYADIEESWILLGQTPIDSIRLPYGLKRFRIEKEGFETINLAPSICKEIDELLNHVPVVFPLFNLDPAGDIPDGMVRILPINISTHWRFFEKFEWNEFLIDKYEVTNKDFKDFVDSGGYQQKKYWKHPFIKDGQILTWQEAISFFVDKTNKPGPSTWEVGDYPKGEGDYPVTGVSWYEAAAFADFKGKSLPTITHWLGAAGQESGPYILRFSNFYGKGTVPVGTMNGIGPYGTYDMAGNAREWCWNEKLPENQRFLIGGGWNDNDFEFGSTTTGHDPFNRFKTNGFRCAKYMDKDTSLASLRKPVEWTYRDVYKDKPVTDNEFNLILQMYKYDDTDLNPVIEYINKSERDWILERISFDAAYGSERVIAYLFLPQKGQPPFQTIVYVSGGHAFGGDPSSAIRINHTTNFDFIIKSGRAVLFPVYKGTFERSYNPSHIIWTAGDYFQRDFAIMVTKDLCRSIDYLTTRIDIDTTKLAYFGLSWGAAAGGCLLGIEIRFKAAILYIGGFWLGEESLPELDQLNFLPRIKMPILMLNGKYDHWFPYEASQKPFYEFLGTPLEHKKHFTYDTWHLIPRDRLIKETLAWLDKYLGPVD